MSIEKIKKAREALLAKQAAELAKMEEQIKQAELVARHKTRVERLAAKLISKHPSLFLADPAVVEAKLGEAIAAVAAGL